MRNLIGLTALAAGLMLGSAALAAPVVQQDVVGRTGLGAPIEGVTASQPVSFADLNLTNPADVEIADQRIRTAAEADCTALRDRSSGAMIPVLSGGRCVRIAEQDARSSLNAAVTAANALQ